MHIPAVLSAQSDSGSVWGGSSGSIDILSNDSYSGSSTWTGSNGDIVPTVDIVNVVLTGTIDTGSGSFPAVDGSGMSLILTGAYIDGSGALVVPA